MNCEEYKILINSFIDEDLETEKQVNLFTHLSECTECRSFLDSIVKYRKTLKAEKIFPPQELDDWIFSEISKRKIIYGHHLKNEKRASFWDWSFSIRAPFAAVFIILLIVLGIFFFNSFNRKYETLEAQQVSFMNDPANKQIKYIIVTEMPEIEVLGNQISGKKVNSAIYHKY